MTRAFIALPVPHSTAVAIERWRQDSLPPLEHPVPSTNYHVTLAFLGELRPAECDQVTDVLAREDHSAIDVSLDTVGYWPGNGTLWLGLSTPPEALLRLQQTLIRQLGRAGFRLPRRSFTPHITLARRCEVAPPSPLMPPDFNYRHADLCLFESVRGKSGVRYEVLAGLSLRQ